MTKTPEELTADWKAGKLEDGAYYIQFNDGCVKVATLETWYEEPGKRPEKDFSPYFDSEITSVLAPVPTYDEYKAMQEELTEFKRAVTSYVGKPIDYDIACETINKLLDDKEKLKKGLAEYRIDKAKMEEKIADLLTDLSSSSMYQIILNEDIGKLRGLLRECDKAFEKIQYNYGYDDSAIELSEPLQLKIREALK